jgi:DNA-binding MarR family transcriptional regulator/GNAT superfamily N-acetyltransferase
MSTEDSTVATIRRFNRHYTRAIGALDQAFLGGPLSLAEARVLYEIAHRKDPSAGMIAEALDLDAGYLSRMLSRMLNDGLLKRQPSTEDRRSSILTLSMAGEAQFASINARMVARIETLIAGLSPPDRARLAQALETARNLLEPTPPAPVTLRSHQPGDMGWVVERHAAIYGAEYGWGPKIEGVTARIVADFLDGFSIELERCWIAEREGQRLGCVFLVREPEAPGVARLRLLLLDPAARGMGLGRRLVDECVAFARTAGYREVVLWTHAVLLAARGIYAATGFQIEATWTHDEFGSPEVSETWRLKL